MHEALPALLIPRVERVPVEAGRAGHPVDRVVAEDPHGARPVQAARAQAVAACRALAEALLVVFVDEEAQVDVVGRDVVLRVVRPFPDVPRPGGVEDLLAAERGPHAARRWFDVIGLRDHLRVVATGCDKCYGHRVSLRNSVSPADLVHRYCHAGYSSIHADKLLATRAARNLPLARWLLRIRIRRSGGL